MRSKNAGWLLLVIIGLLGMVGAISGCGSLPDDAAASVNGVIITKEDVDARLADLRKNYGPMIPQEDADGDGELDDAYTDFRREVADQLTREELERQEAEKRDVTVSQEDIDDALQATADDGYLGDVDRLLQSYYDRGFNDEQLKADISRQILHDKLQDDVIGDIEITDDDIQAYYDQHIEEYRQPERRSVRQIVVSDETTAQEAVTRARAGEDYIDLVRELSEDPDVPDTIGHLGLLKPGDLAPELDEVAFSLELLAVSDPVKLGQQYYILRPETILPPVDVKLEEVKDEIRVFAGNSEASSRWRAFISDVLEDAEIEFSSEYDPANKVNTSTDGT